MNFLGFRHHKRVDATTEKLYTLSDQSRRIASGLQKDVNIIRFAKTPDTDFKDLVTEYANLSPHVHYQEIDPQEKPEVARQYNVTKMNDVVVSSGTHNETLSGTTEQDVTNSLAQGHARHREDDLFPQGPWRARHRLDRTGRVRRGGRHAEE